MNMTHRVLALSVAMGLSLPVLANGVEIEQPPEHRPSRDDWGSVGLMQTPTARMAPEGEIAFTASVVSPYNRYNISLQPFPWLEATYRYSNVVGKRYGPEHFSGDQNFKDKSIDVKLRLWSESRWIPEVSLGMRDIGGTGLFSSEYLVASKRFGNFDVSLGAATGYMGNRGDLSNPLGWLDDRFKTRPVPTANWENAGKFGAESIFRGRVGLFGGVSYQAPGSPWQFKMEVDGNDYHQEPNPLKIDQDAPINVGVVYSPNDNVRLSVGWERGNTLMASLTLYGLAGRAKAPGLLSQYRPGSQRLQQAAEVGGKAGEGAELSRDDWEKLASLARWEGRAGIVGISQRGSELVVDVESSRFFQDATTLGRIGRVLDAGAPDDVNWITLRRSVYGMPLVEQSVPRQAFREYLAGERDAASLALQTEVNRPVMAGGEVRQFRDSLPRFYGKPSLDYRHVMGGGEGLLYEIEASYDAMYQLTRSSWWRGKAETSLFGTFDRYRFSGASRMPRVRTYVREYATTSDVRLPNFEFTTVRKLGVDTYGSIYAGLLESMFGGVGAEVLHRPLGERWAIGGNINWVRQRDFAQDFSFRNYEVVTGHVDFHYRLGNRHRVDAVLSAGRYLAGDWGVTANLSRRFDNGVVMGAWASKTNVSSATFGEGSFDKGIYFSVPMEFILPLPSRKSGGFYWRPIQRDGAAMLNRSFPLYELTNPRDSDILYSNIGRVAD